MIFSSLIFLCVFLPLTLFGYFITPEKGKNFFFLLASLIFFSWGNAGDLIILLPSILVSYGTGLAVQKLDDREKLRRAVFIVGVILNVSILVYYKYFHFIIGNINHFFGMGLPDPNILMPVGISFFTFKCLSYSMDVYFRQVRADKNLLHIALYISMFPHLVAGPIVKYRDIGDQLTHRRADSALFCSGIRRFILGLSKKVLLADILGQTVDKIFDTAGSGIDTPTAWLGIVCYTFQIYLDFSGYSDMAIGVGRMFGFSCAENFRYPYISTSITEFWRRWHISLSTWFRDYLYIPMGGNRRGNVYFHLFVVFLVTGIWHGASWNFILWGLWHGMFIILEKLLMKRNLYDKIPVPLRWASTIFLVMMAWVLFRSDGTESALRYFGYLFGWNAAGKLEFTFLYYLDIRLLFVLAVSAAASVPFFAASLQKRKNSRAVAVAGVPILLSLLVLCMIFVVNNSYSPFIYFQF